MIDLYNFASSFAFGFMATIALYHLFNLFNRWIKARQLAKACKETQRIIKQQRNNGKITQGLSWLTKNLK